MKVSICIPTYNQAFYLIKAVKSAYHQTLPPYEIIVSNDCSTDDTSRVLADLEKEIPVLKVFHQSTNLGISKNSDFCLRKASGEFIVRLDSDDFLSSDYIKNLSEELIKYPTAGYAHGAVQEVDETDTFTRVRKLARKPGFQTSDDALSAAVQGYRVAANIIMFRKDALKQVDYLSNRPDYVEDYHLSATLAASGFGNIYVDQILSYYRIWIDAGKVRQRRKLLEITGLYRVFNDILEPAFKKRGWSLSILSKKRIDFACAQADCLGWDVYNANEKKELKVALKSLSNAGKVRAIIFLYSSGFGKPIYIYRKVQLRLKSLIKKFVLK